eukprot:CAMPEP_0179005136 /NCGR_PEP_ID=MMETSP0795-20121207/13737_1 /TAXON_ID=88552 /ORGANISM="Amoebophrya sp., Strain Ameob2" /LENGTH=753 /DNA_ID=CAMNT_0020699565 /DNA_START=199 /DNA_END=2460 /DNA_ORIENTATION=-
MPPKNVQAFHSRQQVVVGTLAQSKTEDSAQRSARNVDLTADEQLGGHKNSSQSVRAGTKGGRPPTGGGRFLCRAFSIANKPGHHGNEDRFFCEEHVLETTATSTRSSSSRTVNALENTDLFMVGVLDGHDGSSCAELVAEHLPVKVMNLLNTGDHDHHDTRGRMSVHEAHCVAFRECEDLMRQKAANAVGRNETSGSCVNSVSVREGVIYCSNLGDCRAVYIPLADCREWTEVVKTCSTDAQNANDQAAEGDVVVPSATVSTSSKPAPVPSASSTVVRTSSPQRTGIVGEDANLQETRTRHRSSKGGNSTSTTSSDHDDEMGVGSSSFDTSCFDPEFRSNAAAPTLVRGLTKETLATLGSNGFQGVIPHDHSQGMASLASSGAQTGTTGRSNIPTRGLTKESTFLPAVTDEGPEVDGGSSSAVKKDENATVEDALIVSPVPPPPPEATDAHRSRSAPISQASSTLNPSTKATSFVFSGRYRDKIHLGRFSWLSRDFRADKTYERARMRQLGFTAIVNGRVCGCLEPSRTIGDLDIKAQIPNGVISIVPETRSVDMARAHSSTGGGVLNSLPSSSSTTSGSSLNKGGGSSRNILAGGSILPGGFLGVFTGRSKSREQPEPASHTKSAATNVVQHTFGRPIDQATLVPQTAAPPPDKIFQGIIIQGTDGLWDGLSGDEIYTNLMKHSDGILQMQKYLLLPGGGGGPQGGEHFNPEDPDTIALLEKLAMDLTNVSYRKPDVADDCTAVVTMVSWKY